MIRQLRTWDRGVSVTVELGPGVRVSDRWSKETVELASVRHTFDKRPRGADAFSATGRGCVVKRDGTVGRAQRTNITVGPADLPEEVRAAMVDAAQAVFDARGAS